ncbi:MAG: IS110 family transposase [Nitrosotalea sp.]
MISVGIDVGKRRCVATLKRNSKEILEQITFQNRTSDIRELIEHIRRYHDTATAVVESTGNYWIRLHDTLEDNGINTLLANPLQVKAIAKARLKDDKIDSNILTDLLRADLVPESFVPQKEGRELRQLVRTRIDLVYSRSSIKNKIHAILAKYEYDSPVLDIFSARGIEWLGKIDLSWIDRMAVDAYVKTLDIFDLQIDIFTKKIASISKQDSNVRLLMTIPGVDYLTALAIMSEIVYIERFSTPWKLVSYAGLAPSRRDSGQARHRGGITRQGSRWLRFALVEAAGTTKRFDERLGKFYDRISARRGPQKAKVAVAKEMLVIMWHMLTNSEPYRTMNHDMTERKYKKMDWESRTV